MLSSLREDRQLEHNWYFSNLKDLKEDNFFRTKANTAIQMFEVRIFCISFASLIVVASNFTQHKGIRWLLL